MRFELLGTFAILFASLTMAGCTSQRCKTDVDCFAPEVCVERSCEPPAAEDADASSNSNQNPNSNSNPDGGATDVGFDADQPSDLDHPADMSVPPDLRTTDAGEVDTGRDQDFASCSIDPFTFMCTDDPYEPNNIQFEAEPLGSQGAGCPPGVDFVPFLGDVEGTVCPADGSDWFRLNFTECDDAAFIIELQVELLSDCDPNIVGLRTPQFDCADDLVQCTIEDGKPTLRAILEAKTAPVTRSLYVEVHNKMQQDVTFDYELSVEVRR